MDWNKASGLSGVGTFILSVVMVGLMVWAALSPQSAQAPSATQGASHMTTWIIPGVLGLCIVLAAILHFVAASRTVRKPSATGEVSGTDDKTTNADAGAAQESKAVTRQDELESLHAQYKRLLKIAEAQTSDISRYVHIEKVIMIGDRSLSPCLYLHFYIRNKSFHHICIDDQINGSIKLGEDPLHYNVKVSDNGLKNCPPSEERLLAIKQPLTEGEVKRIFDYFGDKVGDYLHLDDLNITVKGVEGFSQVTPQRLITKGRTPKFPAPNVQRLKDRIKELERGKAALEKELIKTSHDESADEEAVNASPKLKIEVLHAMYRGYVSRNEGILAMIVNMKVHLTNLQSKRIDIKGFRLRVILQGIAYVSYAEHGEIYESKFKDNKGEIKQGGKRLQNLNYNNESPIGIEPEQPVGGWLQFFIDGQFASDADPTPSATLTVIDALGREYSEDCILRRNN